MGEVITPLSASKQFYVAPKLARIASKLSKVPLESIASAVEIIDRGHSFIHPKAIFDARDLNRITGAPKTTSLEGELARVHGGKIDHGGTKAYKTKGLLLHKGTFYRGLFRYPVGLDHAPGFSTGKAECFQGGVLWQCWLGSKYFGHSLHEELPTALLGQERGELVSIARPATGQQTAYLDFFGVKSTVLPNSAWIDSLEIISDNAYSQSRITRWKKMRALLRTAAGNPRHQGVFLMRGDTGERRQLNNEEALANHLIKKGFRVINPGLSDFDTILATVAGAQVVIGVEGSQLVHGLLCMAEQSSMVVIQPPTRFDNAHKEPCDLLGIQYSFLVAQPSAGGFSIPLDEVDRALERIDQ